MHGQAPAVFRLSWLSHALHSSYCPGSRMHCILLTVLALACIALHHCLTLWISALLCSSFCLQVSLKVGQDKVNAE